MIGQILSGVGIAVLLFSRAASGVGWEAITGIILNLGAAGVYVWAVLKWHHATELTTRKTTFRSWKVNFVAFWVYLGVTVLNIVLLAI